MSVSCGPAACADCGSADVERHCPSRNCTWSRCKACASVTGLVRGQAAYIPGQGRRPRGTP